MCNCNCGCKARTVYPRITLRISERRALAAYGLGRFPVTLFRNQWLAILAYADDIRAFLDAHPTEIADTKPENVPRPGGM